MGNDGRGEKFHHRRTSLHAAGTSKPLADQRRAVSEDATLDDFFENADEATEESEASSGESEKDEDRSGEARPGDELEGDRSGDASVVLFAPIVRWTPGGEPCEDCGKPVERRWAQEAGDDSESDERAFVCRDCKQW